jgi:hypothetical protein
MMRVKLLSKKGRSASLSDQGKLRAERGFIGITIIYMLLRWYGNGALNSKLILVTTGLKKRSSGSNALCGTSVMSYLLGSIKSQICHYAFLG